MILEGTQVEAVTVNGQNGWWVEGGVHAFFYRDATGAFVDTSLRLVGSALIWEESGLPSGSRAPRTWPRPCAWRRRWSRLSPDRDPSRARSSLLSALPLGPAPP